MINSIYIYNRICLGMCIHVDVYTLTDHFDLWRCSFVSTKIELLSLQVCQEQSGCGKSQSAESPNLTALLLKLSDGS